MQAKIRRAQLQKVPYMLIIGDKEQAADAVAVRLRSGEDLGAMPVEAFIARAQADIAARVYETATNCNLWPEIGNHTLKRATFDAW